jgi:hypothetical protein
MHASVAAQLTFSYLNGSLSNGVRGCTAANTPSDPIAAFSDAMWCPTGDLPPVTSTINAIWGISSAKHSIAMTVFARPGSIDHLVLTLSRSEGGSKFSELDLTSLRHGFEAKLWLQLECNGGLRLL